MSRRLDISPALPIAVAALCAWSAGGCSSHAAVAEGPDAARQAPQSDASSGVLPPDAGDEASPPDGAAPPDAGSTDGHGSAWTGLQVAGTTFVDGAGQEVHLRGIGIGEWLNIESYMIDASLPSDSPGMGETGLRARLAQAMGDAGADQFFAAWEASVVTEADVALWQAWGVNSVRLPLNYHALSSAPGIYLEAGFRLVDRFVAWCKAHRIYVILDLHAAPGAQNCEEMSDTPDGVAHLWAEPTTYRQWTIDLWQAIAARYAGETAVGGFDVFDEPYDTESDGTFSGGIGVLRQMYLDVTAAIRAVDPHHVLFFEGAHWSSIDLSAKGVDGFAGLAPAWDGQMAWSFHKYWDPNTTASIQGYLDLRSSTNRPVWNGETGEDSKSGWSGSMIALMEANDIGWNEWTYKKVANTADFYSIDRPKDWKVMRSFFRGGAAPPAAQARTLMMQLAANAATSRCVLQKPWLNEIFGK